MASKSLAIRATGFKPLLPLLRGRIIDLRPAGNAMIQHLRFGGTGSIEDHFLSQRYYTPRGGYAAWRPSKRAIREGNLTLVDTGAYRAAWLGQGVGSRTSRERDRVRVGVDQVRFPQVNVFQGDRIVRGNAPRRIGIGPTIVRGIRDIMLRYFATGKV